MDIRDASGRPNRADGGGFWPTLITLILAVIGVGWQYSNITKWVRTTRWIQAIDAVRERHK